MVNIRNEIKETRIYRIPKQLGVDPIDLFIDWYGDEKSQVTIRCWDTAWTAYWGGHWDEKVERFLVDEKRIGYLVNSFSRTHNTRETKWLRNIMASVQEHLKQLGFEKAKADEEEN